MTRVDDDTLILYHYGDGLDADERARVDAALAASPELRARLALLRRVLAAADAVAPPLPDAGFETRMKRRFRAATGAVASPSSSSRTRRPRRRRVLAWSAAAAAVLALGVVIGRLSLPVAVPPAPPVVSTQPPSAAPVRSDASARVLDAYVAAHLRATEAALLTAVHGDDGAIGTDAELAASLIDSNRLYAAAAARAGNARLADFLQRLEPVLIELANPPRGGDVEVRDGLRDYVQDEDLLFEVRATKARLSANRSQRT